MAKTQIGAQMYTLREHCQTPADIAKTCKKLADMGFGAIQASAAGFNTIEASELKKILDDTGLVCAATHRSLDSLKNETDAVIDWHKTVGCELTAIGGFGHSNDKRADWEGFVKDYNALAPKFAQQGLRIGYHNHSHEFCQFDYDPAKVDSKNTPMQLLVDKLDDAAWFEIDTYWVAHGGGDPAAWIRKCKGRIPAIHVKDMIVTPEREHKMCEVGTGNLNWPAILDACKDAGVQWYLIERDSGDLDPFESLKKSLDNLKAMGLN
ncbi:sugar phosphate isomerase/epimerase family protein [Phycisphaerales bacterium AB-hyl4]|uniref:Sugar phosphate isomerase/epimerase family protein n=1 Tax=Natronomicrosphaera hydrolytica TaxID=3242702 RepID=A0ABV4U074_9BACT